MDLMYAACYAYQGNLMKAIVNKNPGELPMGVRKAFTPTSEYLLAHE